MATEETTISELELADELLADMNIAVDTATETRAITLKQLKAWLGSSLPTGLIVASVGKINDERFTLLDGKTLSRVGTYEAFCNKVVEQVQAGNWFACSEEEYNADISAYGQCGRFVIANDYVRIPKITRFIGATITLSEIGKTYKESLPNITGTFNNNGHSNNGSDVGVTGAFTFADTNAKSNDGSASDGGQYSFNASRSSSTYQNGAKVQPDHTKYPYYMVISTEGQTAEISVDINKVYEDLELKANSNLSNIPSNIDYVVETYSNGTEWYRVYKSGWIEQGGRFYNNSNTVNTINLHKKMKDTKYICLINHGISGAYISQICGSYTDEPHSFTTTSFKASTYNSVGLNYIQWVVKGNKA